MLLLLLHRRVALRPAGASALQGTLAFLRPTGLLALRTLAVTSVYSLATSLAARTDPAHAAAHQIAFQIWLASSLLADSVAVAAQTLLARSLAAGLRAPARAVVVRTLQAALALGAVLGVGLAVWGGAAARLFTSDPLVLASLAAILPAVVSRGSNWVCLRVVFRS